MGRRIPQEEVEAFYKSEGYEMLSVYKNNRTPLKMKCPLGHITETMTFWSFKKGCRCAECSRKAKLTYEFVKEQIEKEGYKLISTEYKHANEKLTLECSKGHIWKVTYGHFYDGKRCGTCSGNKKHSYKFIKDSIEKEGHKLLSKEYHNAQTKLEIICPKGHYSNTMTWNSFQRGQRCSKCKNSKGELFIMKFLDSKNIEYIREHRFDDCKYKYRLSFDFYIPSLQVCIEFDGIQHFKPIDGFGGKDVFKKVQTRDKVKNTYCKNNNIKLIRIPYFKIKEIDNILIEELNLSH